MRLKPKNTTLNKRALLYRRYTDIQSSGSLIRVYETEDGKHWLFNAEDRTFELLDETAVEIDETTIQKVTASTALGYLGTLYKYVDSSWQVVTVSTKTLVAQFGNIAKYQLNKYYYEKAFDFMHTSSQDHETMQAVKGNILPFSTVAIKFYDDSVGLCVDDLVVINGKLYAVERISIDMKHQPKDYYVYFADLTSIV